MTRQPFSHLLPPECLEAEQQVLGAVLMNNAMFAVIRQHVGAEDFHEAIHAQIFDLASRLIGEGKPATPATLAPFLSTAPLAADMTPPKYLARLCANAMPPVLAPGQAKVIRSIAGRRAIARIGQAFAERAVEMIASEEPAALAAEAIAELQHVAATSGTDTTRSAGDIADGLLETIDGVRSGAIVDPTPTTGYPDLDRAITGYVPGTLVVAAGRPGMGKTALMNSSARRCAQKAGVGVLEFPLEVGAEQLVARHLADLAYCGGGRSPAFRDIGYRGAMLDDNQLEHVRSARDKLRQLPVVIDGRSRVTVAQISAKVLQTKRTMAARGIHLGAVFVDHLDFVQASDRYSGNRTQEIAEICLNLKDLARAEKVCLVLLCQLSRAVENRPEHERRPTLADLRNSGDIEQIADVVAFIYRDEYYLQRSPKVQAGDPDALDKLEAARGKVELVLGKVRAGPTPTVHLYGDMASSSISSAVRGGAA